MRKFTGNCLHSSFPCKRKCLVRLPPPLFFDEKKTVDQRTLHRTACSKMEIHFPYMVRLFNVFRSSSSLSVSAILFCSFVLWYRSVQPVAPPAEIIINPHIIFFKKNEHNKL